MGTESDILTRAQPKIMILRRLNVIFICATMARDNSETSLRDDVYRPIEIASGSDGGHSFPYDQHKCVKIESTFSLCYNMEGGYAHMWLPNFMKHETMKEVIQQTDAWRYVVDRNCHPELQKFLCSLYAPVCLLNEAPKDSDKLNTMVPPCKQLCQKVKSACEPIILEYGYHWPDSLHCEDKFPDLEGKEICVPPDSSVQPGNNNRKSNCKSYCLLGSVQEKDETILKERYCSFDLVYVAKIQKIKKSRGRRMSDSRRMDLKLKFKLPKSRDRQHIFRQNSNISSQELKKPFYLNDAYDCWKQQQCRDLDDAKKQDQQLLIMAKKVERKLIIMHISKWPKNRKYEKRMKTIFLDENCCVGKDKCGK